MQYFSNDFVAFFKELAANNNKDWFDANRKRYESSVKRPFSEFVTALINEVHKDDPAVMIEAKDAIMRINRDIRFAKDKTPYNVHVSAIVSAGGKKDKTIPGLFIRITPEEIQMLGGAYVLEKEQLHQVRSAIANDPKGFEKLLNDNQFAERYGELQGEKNKRLPPEFVAAAETQPLLFNKGFYYSSTLPVKLITSDELVAEVMELYKAGKPMKQFLSWALGH